MKIRLGKRISLPKILTLIFSVLLLGWGIGYSAPMQKLFYPYPHRAVVEKYASLYQVDPLLVMAVMREESKYLPQSESRKGAKGLMQLMPETARWIAGSMGDTAFQVDDLLKPDKNIQYGAWYLANLQKEFSGNIVLVIAAYNGGRGHVKEWIKTDQIDPENMQERDIPFPETKQYVERVLKSYRKYSMLYRNT